MSIPLRVKVRRFLILAFLVAVLSTIAWNMVVPPIHNSGGPLGSVSWNMRQVILAMLAYQYDEGGPGHSAPWPLDEHILVAWSGGDLRERDFKDPRHTDIIKPWIFVRPVPTAKANQPVLISDPRCFNGKCCAIAYADGHVEAVRDTVLWTEANRLAALPKAKTEGIGPDDWTMGVDR